MKISGNEKGFIKPVLTILVVIVFVYAGYQFAVPYYKHSSLKSEAKELARISLGKEDALRDKILNKAEELDLPISRNQIFVMRTGNTMRVQVSWTDKVDIMGLYQKEIDFKIDINE